MLTTKFLGLYITNDLTLTVDTHCLVKAQQRLFLLRKLKKANVPSQLLVNFYRSIIESILCHCITVWYTSCTIQNQGSKLRPFWSHMLPKCNLCDSKIYLGAFVRVQIIAVVRPLQFSAKRSRITARICHVTGELKQDKLFIRRARLKCAFSEPVHPKRANPKACLRGRSHIALKRMENARRAAFPSFFPKRSGGLRSEAFVVAKQPSAALSVTPTAF